MKQPLHIALLLLKKWFRVLPKGNATQDLNRFFNKIDRKSVTDTLSKFEDLDTDNAWTTIQDAMDKTEAVHTPKQVLQFIRPLLKYAAMFTGLGIGLFYFLNDTDSFKDHKTLDVATISEDITLSADDVVIARFSENGETAIKNSKGKVLGIKQNRQLAYAKESNTVASKITNHELYVPNGKTFRVVLSDGTKIYCDAGTTLKYPSRFVIGKTRKVQIKGQAYFDVAKSATDHFIVSTNDTDIKVLGTQFNVSAYPENNNSQTVLVEGAVEVAAKNSKEIMKMVPGQQITFHGQSKKMVLQNVNAYDHTAWLSQKLIFKRVPFSKILKRLERRFGVVIRNSNQDLGKQLFTAKFQTESLLEILNAFSADASFAYETKDNIIHIIPTKRK